MRELITDPELDALLFASSPYLGPAATQVLHTRDLATESASQHVAPVRHRWIAPVVAVAVTVGVLLITVTSISVLLNRPLVPTTPLASTLHSPVSSLYADLDQPPTAKDAVPPEAGGWLWQSVDRESVRFVAVDGAWSIWIASGNAPDTVCLVLYAPTETATTATTGCGSAAGGMTIDASGPGEKFQVVPDNASPPSNATALSKNVYRIGSN